MAASQLYGKVTHFSGGYFTVSVPNAPMHLRTIYLTPAQMRGATVGCGVMLEYQTTQQSGLWNVVAVDKEHAAKPRKQLDTNQNGIPGSCAGLD